MKSKQIYVRPSIVALHVIHEYHILSNSSSYSQPVDPNDPGWDGPWDSKENIFDDEDFNNDQNKDFSGDAFNQPFQSSGIW